MILSQRHIWPGVTCGVTVGINAETWTCPGGIDDAYAALADFVDWYGDAGRPWTASATLELSRVGGETFAGSSAIRWQLSFSDVTALSWSSDALDALQPDDAAAALGIASGAWPCNGWGLDGATTRTSLSGTAAAQGAVRPGIPALAPVRPTAVGGLDYAGTELLAQYLALSPSPRRCWVLGIDGTWRHYALGGVSRERRKTIWVHTLDLAGDAL